MSIDTLNPSQVVLRLPEALAEPSPQTAGTEYLVAVEREVDGAYSTGPDDARRHRSRLTVQHYADEQAFYDGAVAAATTVFNAFIEHARGDDGCFAPEPTRRSPPRRLPGNPGGVGHPNPAGKLPPAGPESI